MISKIDIQMIDSKQGQEEYVSNSINDNQSSILEILSNKHFHAILIKIEHKQDKITGINCLEAEIIERVYKVLTRLLENRMIKEVHANDYNYLVEIKISCMI